MFLSVWMYSVSYRGNFLFIYLVAFLSSKFAPSIAHLSKYKKLLAVVCEISIQCTVLNFTWAFSQISDYSIISMALLYFRGVYYYMFGLYSRSRWYVSHIWYFWTHSLSWYFNRNWHITIDTQLLISYLIFQRMGCEIWFIRISVYPNIRRSAFI